MPESTSFGPWLRQKRRSLDLTQKAFADLVGCAPITLRRMEADQYKPSKELALTLFEKLGIPELERPQWVAFARGMSGMPTQAASQPKKPATNLPASLTSFIGREKEQQEVVGLIEKHRLVTLTGSGGVGKTRLSLKVGEEVLENYENGVWFVELASLNDPSLLPQLAATLFGLRTQPGISYTDLLINFLRAKSMLLILDNCEHLLEACAHLVETLLESCPPLKILVTSREPLEITGEALYRLPSLSLPDLFYQLDTLRDLESVRLFEERAQLIQFDFALTMENAASIVQICRYLDGMPLAIELAAAKVRVLSTAQIARQLEDSLNLLGGGSRTSLPRHQTLRASINWSWSLLTGAEQRLMKQLSVFAGGWTLEAARMVCDGDVLELIELLVRKSLIMMHQQTEDRVRYHFHQTIRQYAHEKLIEADEEEVIQGRHLEYFLKLSEQIEQELVGPQQMEWFRRTNDELNNLRAALEYALRTNVEAGLYIVSRLGQFWPNFDTREGTRWLDAFLQNPDSKEYPHARAKALHTQSQFYIFFQQYKDAQAVAEESLVLFRSVEDQYGQVDSLRSLGETIMFGPMPDLTKGVELAEQALMSARALGDLRRQAAALSLLGWDHRDFKRAFIYWDQATVLYRQSGHWSGLANHLSMFGLFLLMDSQIDAAQKCMDEANLLFQQLNINRRSVLLSSLGQIALMRGDYEQARAYFQEESRISNELGVRTDYLWAMTRLGLVELRTSDITGARQIFAETAQSFQKDGSRIGVVFTLEGMSSLYITVGKADIAARLIGWSDATRKEIGDTRPRLEQADMDKVIAACVAQMGEVAFSDAYDEGQKMTLDEAVALALEENHE